MEKAAEEAGGQRGDGGGKLRLAGNGGGLADEADLQRLCENKGGW